jgi:hypothetical protein
MVELKLSRIKGPYIHAPTFPCSHDNIKVGNKFLELNFSDVNNEVISGQTYKNYPKVYVYGKNNQLNSAHNIRS